MLPSLSSTLSAEVRAAIGVELETRAFDAGHVTPANLRAALRDCVTAAFEGFGERRGGGSGGSGGSGCSGGSEAARSPSALPTYLWKDGTKRLVPENWQLATTVTLSTLVEMHFHGSPLRALQNCMVPEKQRKRLSDARYILRAVQKVAEEKGVWLEDPTPEEVRAMWEGIHDVFSPDPLTEEGRERRVVQLSWTTVVQKWRKAHPVKKRKLPQAAVGDAVDVETGEEAAVGQAEAV
jgi:hypothetical protein